MAMNDKIKAILPRAALDARHRLLRRVRAQRILSDRRFRIEFTRAAIGDETYFVPYYARTRRVGSHILAGKYYEARTHDLVEIILRGTQGDMIHAGTSFGDMLPSFSKKCPGTVYAFEPVLENYVMARLCVQENDLDNVVLMHAALGPEMSNCRMDVFVEDGTHRGGTSRVAAKGQMATMLKIDMLGLEKVALIQLDVEGFEAAALEGAVETIRRNRPHVLVEDNSGNSSGVLSGLGYVEVGSNPHLTLWSHEDRREEFADAIREA